MIFSKKASLNLSINAIVILILAITMLGLGLGFIKNTFGKTAEQFEEIGSDFKNQIIDDIKESNERLVFNKYDIEVKKGKTKELYFGINNDLNADGVFVIKGTGILNQGNIVGSWGGDTPATKSVVECFADLESTAYATVKPRITFDTFATRTINTNGISVLKLIINTPSTTPPSTYSCSMVIGCPHGAESLAAATDTCALGTLYARKDFYVTVN